MSDRSNSPAPSRPDSAARPSAAGPPAPDPAPAPAWRLRPAWFFFGLLAGLALLTWTGRRWGRTDYHPGFVRILPAWSPEANYYPTLGELCSIARAQCRADQVLVVVGGNSILLGVGQPPGDLWSQHLQETLGDRYCVINFAFRGATPTDGGAVVAEALCREFPRQIYVADEAPLNGANCYGGDAYRFLFWQAYFSGRLLDDPVRARRVRDYLRDPLTPRGTRAIVLREEADRVLRFHDFWNRVGFDDFFTVPSLYGAAIPALLVPRRKFGDLEPDVTQEPFYSRRYDPAGEAREMAITRGLIAGGYERTPRGGWAMKPLARRAMADSIGEAFPPALRARTLMLITRSSPHYVRQLTAEEQACTDEAFRDSVAVWRQAGYDAIDSGRDFDDDDYGDRIHLSKSGGRKLAALVAPEIRALAGHLGNLDSKPSSPVP